MNSIKKILFLGTVLVVGMAFAPQVFAEEEQGMQCEPGMDCPMHEDMEMKGSMMMDHGNMPGHMKSQMHDGSGHAEGRHEAKNDNTAHASWLKPVEAKYVCMVTNKVFDVEQIAVDVEGQTYYGCCPMCKAKLQKSTELRQSIDPVSGNIVDKATAIIGADAEDTVYYFENKGNFQSYINKSAQQDSGHSH